MESAALPVPEPALTAIYTAVFCIVATGVAIDAILLVRAGRGRCKLRRAGLIRRRGSLLGQDGPLLLSMLAAVYVLLLSVLSRNIAIDEGQLFRTLAMQTLGIHGTAVGGAVVLLRLRATSWKKAFGIGRRQTAAGIMHGIVAYLAAVPAVAAGTVLWNMLLDRAGVSPGRQEVAQVFVETGHSAGVYILIAALALVAAPFAEELVFRGVALPLLARMTTPLLAIAAASVVFAALHFHMASLVPLFIIGSALGTAYVCSGSLAAPVTAHALFNAGSLAAYYAVRLFPALESGALSVLMPAMGMPGR
ncbi:MAG: CPBP family intramembrane metalloprotease [Lentisphaerae bacterium]|nr:CPBP family intramembrane metalloprotease [Lentisphaerota bacterium]